MDIQEITDIHYAWVEKMGWHNKTVLEELALVGSEVGEAVNECRGEKPTAHLGEELADVILRTVNVAKGQGIDINKAIIAKLKKNEKRGRKPGRIK